MYLKFMPLGKPYPKELSPIIKNMSTKPKSERSKNFYFNTIVLCWWPTQEDASLRNTEDQEPEPDIKNLTDDLYIN